MGKIVGLTFKDEAAKKKADPRAAKYKRMKTAELDALLEERGIEAPEGVTNPQRVDLLVQYDETAEAEAEAEADAEIDAEAEPEDEPEADAEIDAEAEPEDEPEAAE